MGHAMPVMQCGALIWGLENLDEDLWARSVLVPVERVVMLSATSKRVRALLARLPRRMPAAVRAARCASIGSVTSGVRHLLAWCQVVTLELDRNVAAADARNPTEEEDWTVLDGTAVTAGGGPMGNEGVGMLAEALGQCSSLTTLVLGRQQNNG